MKSHHRMPASSRSQRGSLTSKPQNLDREILLVADVLPPFKQFRTPLNLFYRRVGGLACGKHYGTIAHVRDMNLEALRNNDTKSIETNVIYALVTKT
jgi:hypothetical protein